VANRILFVILTVILVVGSHSFAGTIQPPQTGQTICSDTTGKVAPCAGTGQDGDVRAGVAWPNPRFTITYCDTNGPCADQGSDCDGNPSTDMVKDNLTGLVWARDGNLPNEMKTWQEALNFSNNLNLCGYSDWSLPNINELESLVHAGQSSSATWLNTQGFTNVQSIRYWSSSSYAGLTFYAHIVGMLNGFVGANDKDDFDYVWPVRSVQSPSPPAQLWETGQTICYNSMSEVIPCAGTGQDGELKAGVAWPNNRFSVSGDCVSDNLTGLIWAKNANLPNGFRTWQQALDFVASMNSGSGLCGYYDWRLPNRKELRSLIDYSQSELTHPFINVSSVRYWSSSSYEGSANVAWTVSMWNGHVGTYSKDGSSLVWLVRSGRGALGYWIYLPIIIK
jgi:hypothetical protein